MQTTQELTTTVAAAILNRLIEPETADLSAAAARWLLRLDFQETDHERMAVLSAKAQSGTLTTEERAELGEYLRIADLLAVLQSKTRRSLRRRRAS